MAREKEVAIKNTLFFAQKCNWQSWAQNLHSTSGWQWRCLTIMVLFSLFASFLISRAWIAWCHIDVYLGWKVSRCWMKIARSIASVQGSKREENGAQETWNIVNSLCAILNLLNWLHWSEWTRNAKWHWVLN